MKGVVKQFTRFNRFNRTLFVFNRSVVSRCSGTTTNTVDPQNDPLDVIGALTEAERVSGTTLDFAKIVSIGNQSR